MSTSAFGSISLSVSFAPSLNSGTDPQGFDGSTWTFQFDSSQTTYGSAAIGEPSIITDSAFLTVSGATNNAYNGTFAITETNTTNFASLPNSFGSLYLGLDTNALFADFTFGPGPINVSHLGLQGTPLTNPSTGNTILLADWQGASVSDGSVTIGSGDFDLGSGTVNVNAAVPEPSTTAALFGLVTLGSVLLRRRLIKVEVTK